MTRKTPKPGAAYYDGGHRFVRDGIPCRMAPWVADLTALSRDSLLRGTSKGRNDRFEFTDVYPSSLPPDKRASLASVRHPQTTYLPPEPKDR